MQPAISKQLQVSNPSADGDQGYESLYRTVVLLGLIVGPLKKNVAWSTAVGEICASLRCIKLTEALDQQYARPADAVRYCFGALKLQSSNIVALRASQAWDFVLDSHL